METLDKKLLGNIKYFNTLQDSELETILQAPENGVVEYSRKKTIFCENEVGEYMYIMLEGMADVFVRRDSRREISIASLKPGDFFGDGAVTSEGEKRRTGTVKTVLESKVFKIHKKYVLDAIKGSISAEPLPSDEVRDLLITIPIFKGLTDDEIRDTKSWARTVNYKKDDFIHEPDMAADELFVVLEGKVQTFVTDANGNNHIISNINAGQYFGEIELLPGSNGKHYQFAVALTDSRIIHISKKIFDALLERNETLTAYLKQMNQLKKIRMDHTQTSD